MRVINCYLDNAKNGIFRNLVWYLKHGENGKEEYLNKLIVYCEKLLADPDEPKERKRIRRGKKYKTKEADDGKKE